MSETRGTSDAGANTPEGVALKLLIAILHAEGKAAQGLVGGSVEVASKEWLLDTYSECLDAVKGNRRPRPSGA